MQTLPFSSQNAAFAPDAVLHNLICTAKITKFITMPFHYDPKTAAEEAKTADGPEIEFRASLSSPTTGNAFFEALAKREEEKSWMLVEPKNEIRP